MPTSVRLGPAAFLLMVVLGPWSSHAAKLEPCRVAGAELECGTVERPEDPERPGQRTIPIRVLRAPALSGEAGGEVRSDPLLVIEGGPGASSVAAAPAYLPTFAALRAERDLLFVDLRGTGESNGLDCEMEGDLAAPVAAEVARCRAELEERARLELYTTPFAADDVAAVVRELGYERVNVFGMSYGSRTALVLARRHPQLVRSLLLLGTYPPQRNAVLDSAAILERSLDLLVEGCAGDPSCDAAFPELASAVAAVARRARESDDPDVATIPARARLMAFYPMLARTLPRALHRAAAGDDRDFAAVEGLLASALQLSEGVFLTVLCSEDVARVERAELERRSAGTFLGTGFGEPLLEACAQWPAGRLPADYHRPFDVDLPLLSMTGELDPSMPPAWGEELASRLPRARHLTLPQGQHALMGMRGVDCVVRLMTDFVEAGSAEGLDVGCLDQLVRPPFAVD